MLDRVLIIIFMTYLLLGCLFNLFDECDIFINRNNYYFVNSSYPTVDVGSLLSLHVKLICVQVVKPAKPNLAMQPSTDYG